MSSDGEPVSLAASRYRLPIPGAARAAIIMTAWVPIIYLLSFSLPRFVAIFERMEARIELPALTQVFVWIGRINSDWYSIPIPIVVLGLGLADLGLPHVLGPSRGRRWFHWFWFASSVGLGVLAIPIYIWAMQLPVFRFGEALG